MYEEILRFCGDEPFSALKVIPSCSDLQMFIRVLYGARTAYIKTGGRKIYQFQFHWSIIHFKYFPSSHVHSNREDIYFKIIIITK